jgi:hypothetical protein
MKLGTQVHHYDRTFLTKNQININHRKTVFEGFSWGVSPPVVEGLVGDVTDDIRRPNGTVNVQ